MMDFKLNYSETNKLKIFNSKHFNKCNSGTSVIFTNTSIGTKIEIRCNKCLKVKDISDYSSW
jgi:hypothetical protein